jgi:hypothetical protein
MFGLKMGWPNKWITTIFVCYLELQTHHSNGQYPWTPVLQVFVILILPAFMCVFYVLYAFQCCTICYKPQKMLKLKKKTWLFNFIVLCFIQIKDRLCGKWSVSQKNWEKLKSVTPKFGHGTHMPYSKSSLLVLM